MKLWNKLQNRTKRFCVWMLIVMMCVTMLPLQPISVRAEEKVIRIGYDANSNFIKESDGNYYGYGVEYLEKIAEYTGWKYEYVKDDSWHNCLEMLRNGEIDVICTAHYTDERAKEFTYSDIPLGYEASLLYTKADSSIAYQDYEAMNGAKVGLLVDSYSAQDFEKYAIKVGVEYYGVYYNEEDEMLRDLEENKIDMMVIASRYATSELKLIDTSGANPFYCIANKANQTLIDEIDQVLEQIIFDEPAFEGTLMENYFGHNALTSMPLYTKEELEYMKSLGTVKIKMLQNQKPSCYIENGQTKGIWADIIRLLANKTGIDLVLEASTEDSYSEETYQKYLENGYLLLRTQRAMEFNSGIPGAIVSNPLTNVSVAYIKRQAAFVEDKYVSSVIAMTKDLAYLEPLLEEENPDYVIKYFEDAKSCFEALVNKEAGMIIQNSHRASYLMQKPEYAEKLVVVPGVDHGNDVRIVGMEEQALLIGILNKAMHHISNAEFNEVVKRELLMNPYPLEWEDIVYQYWKWIVLIGFIIGAAMVVYTVLTQRLAAAKVQKKEYELLKKKVQLDEVTGLYNRSYFYEMARELINETDEEMCIITMDISNFKVVNELYGMNVGDRLLKEIGQQVQKLDKNHHMIPARFMADHYYMCMPKSEFDQIEFPKSFHTFLEDMDIRVVYGVFLVEDHKEMPVNIMCDRAFLAVHDKNYKYVEYIHFYNDREHQQMLEEQEIENEMEKALEERQFYIVVQPKYDPATRKIVGGETLVRWQHPQKGIISPGIFIPVFEKDGFIIQLDYFVWEETCRFQAEMKQKGIQIVPISINVSRAHFYGSELQHKLRELIEKYQLETKDIELEITESICGEDSENIYDTIRELQKEGYKIAMDDFGSGYSSLNMLKEMPLDIIKMDLKFLDGEENKGRLILKSLIEMAQAMGLKIVVEGVEILSQVEFLCQFKDCYLQGYYFSRPVIAEVFEEMIDHNI